MVVLELAAEVEAQTRFQDGETTGAARLVAEAIVASNPSVKVLKRCFQIFDGGGIGVLRFNANWNAQSGQTRRAKCCGAT